MDRSINLWHRAGGNNFWGSWGGGGYNSAFFSARGTEQQVKINGQFGVLTEGGFNWGNTVIFLRTLLNVDNISFHLL